jgi:hypothetical protein
MVVYHDTAVGVSFARPADWVPVEQPKNGNASASFGQRSAPPGQVRATLQVSMEDHPGCIAKIDVDAPAPPTATGSKVFTIDGVPARLTAYDMPPDVPSQVPDAEILTVQTAKGSRHYTITMVFPKVQHEMYLQIADDICKSLKLSPTR